MMMELNRNGTWVEERGKGRGGRGRMKNPIDPNRLFFFFSQLISSRLVCIDAQLYHLFHVDNGLCVMPPSVVCWFWRQIVWSETRIDWIYCQTTRLMNCAVIEKWSSVCCLTSAVLMYQDKTRLVTCVQSLTWENPHTIN